jgi:hypothetical protein
MVNKWKIPGALMKKTAWYEWETCHSNKPPPHGSDMKGDGTYFHVCVTTRWLGITNRFILLSEPSVHAGFELGSLKSLLIFRMWCLIQPRDNLTSYYYCP